MSALSDLPITDMRDKLPRADWRIGTRQATTSITDHYNGPPVPDNRRAGAGLLDQLVADVRWQMRPGWGGTKNGADGLMYHFVFPADGAIWQMRDLDALLWHCAHQDGNARGLALHVPIGQGQAPTAEQLAALFRVSDALRADYGISFARVLGHLEWKHATACPGPSLMAHLTAYRAGRAPIVAPTPPPPGIRRFRLRDDLTAPARVRQGPALGYPVAGRMKPGTILFVDVVKVAEDGDPDNPRWIHMARVEHEQADLGFVSEALGVWL